MRRPLRFARRRDAAVQMFCEALIIASLCGLIAWCMYAAWTGPR